MSVNLFPMLLVCQNKQMSNHRKWGHDLNFIKDFYEMNYARPRLISNEYWERLTIQYVFSVLL